jgi:hypothetical protein
LIYLKVGSLSYIIDKLWRFIPESIVISLLAPFFFSILERIWRSREQGIMGDEA